MMQRSQAGRSPVTENQDVEYQDDAKKSSASMTVSNMLLIIGTILLCLVILSPIWDAVTLLYSSTYAYFIGRSECIWTLLFCVFVVVFYIMTMHLTTRFARPEMKTDQTFMYVFISTLTLLGLGLLVASTPMRNKSSTAYNQLLGNCNAFPRTEPLYWMLKEKYSELLTLRLTPDCINKVSIEQCAGYQADYPYTSFLKEMEFTYECSGFCYSGPAFNHTEPPLASLVQQNETTAKAQDVVDAVAASLPEHEVKAGVARHIQPRDEVKTDLVAALQGRSSQQQKVKRRKGVSLLTSDMGSNETVPLWEHIPKGRGNTGQEMVATGWMNKYPPNLFTDANYKTSCDGAAARELRFGAMEAGVLMYMEGAALLVIAAFAGFMKLCAMCRKPQGQAKNAAGFRNAALAAHQVQ